MKISSLTSSTLLIWASITSTQSCGTATDADNDGYYTCPTEGMTGQCDCDDSNPLVYPGANEANSPGDDDCDGISEWAIKFGWFDDPIPFEDPVQLSNGTIAVLYSQRRCIFSNIGSLIGCGFQVTSSGDRCFIEHQLVNRDGNLVMVGPTEFYPDSPVPLCFMIVDPTTAEILEERFDLPQERYTMTELIESSDGGYIISGGTYTGTTDPPQSVPQFQASLMKLKADGSLEWARSYGPVFNWNYGEWFDDVTETISHDIVAKGRSCDAVPESCEWIIRLDSLGNEKWTLSADKTVDFILLDSVAAGISDEVILVGEDSVSGRDLILAVGPDANILWRWEGASNSTSVQVMTLWDGSIITASWITEPGYGNTYLSTNHLDSGGGEIWKSKKALRLSVSTYGLNGFADGSIMISGLSSDVSTPPYAVLVRLDSQANPPPISVIEMP